jgi:hypothetical protein
MLNVDPLPGQDGGVLGVPVGVRADGEEAELIHPKNGRDATQTDNEIFHREAQEDSQCRFPWSSRLMGGFVAACDPVLSRDSSTGVGASGEACPRNRFGRGI